MQQISQMKRSNNNEVIRSQYFYECIRDYFIQGNKQLNTENSLTYTHTHTLYSTQNVNIHDATETNLLPQMQNARMNYFSHSFR